MLLTMLILSSVLMIVPWTNSLWAVDTVYTIIGVAVAILMVGKCVFFLLLLLVSSTPYVSCGCGLSYAAATCSVALSTE